MKMKRVVIGVLATMVVAGSYAEFSVSQDSFGAGENAFTIDFVDIGGAGNAADLLTGNGAVDYNYRIGQTEITVRQFMAACATDSRISDASVDIWNGGGPSDSYGAAIGPDAPASHFGLYDAMRFANYLTTGNAIEGVYQFDDEGTELLATDRSYRNDEDMAFVVPTEDEWYKAAYYSPADDGSYSLYANGGSDTNQPPTVGTAFGWNYGVPETGKPWEVGVGAQEQNGTYDMMGNVWEWNESSAIRGGGAQDATDDDLRSTTTYDYAPNTEGTLMGFRVAAIPEPASLALIGLFGGGIVFIRRIFML